MPFGRAGASWRSGRRAPDALEKLRGLRAHVAKLQRAAGGGEPAPEVRQNPCARGVDPVQPADIHRDATGVDVPQTAWTTDTVFTVSEPASRRRRAPPSSTGARSISMPCSTLDRWPPFPVPEKIAALGVEFAPCGPEDEGASRARLRRVPEATAGSGPTGPLQPASPRSPQLSNGSSSGAGGASQSGRATPPARPRTALPPRRGRSAPEVPPGRPASRCARPPPPRPMYSAADAPVRGTRRRVARTGGPRAPRALSASVIGPGHCGMTGHMGREPLRRTTSGRAAARCCGTPIDRWSRECVISWVSVPVVRPPGATMTAMPAMRETVSPDPEVARACRRARTGRWACRGGASPKKSATRRRDTSTRSP